VTVIPRPILDLMKPDDLNVIITRPRHQNSVLAEKCRLLGIRCHCFPCIEISPISSKSVHRQLEHALDDYDFICFTSPNAVTHGLNSLPQLKHLPAHTHVAAVGESSARALRNHGFNTIITPTTTTDTEGLLAALEQYPLTGKKALIIKGMGGRELLKQVLQNKCCLVNTCEVYQRVLPSSNSPLPEHIDAILFTSSESAENFVRLNHLQENAWLLDCQTIVGHPKISEKVSSLGFKKAPIIAASPTDGDMYQAILTWLVKSA